MLVMPSQDIKLLVASHLLKIYDRELHLFHTSLSN